VLPGRVTFFLSAAFLTGCGASGGPAATAVSQSANFAVFSGSVDLTGEIGVKGTFKDALTSRQETCDACSRGLAPATTIWVVPTPNNASPVGGHLVTLTAGVPNDKPSSGYEGPGTYSPMESHPEPVSELA